MENQDAKKQTQGTRTIQTTDISSSDTGSSGGFDESSNQSRLESVVANGENWSGGNKVKGFIRSTVGKLIDRLIDSWRDRKKEAVDCLDWYNDQVNKCDKEIELLELMKVELTEALPEEE